jgi:nucleotide-binding universal stress UspA family protein
VPNPLSSEGEAFRFLLGTVVYFALIAIAGVINEWAGLVVFIVLTIAVAWWWWRSRQPAPPRQATGIRGGPPGEKRILVIANETVGGAPLLDKIKERAASEDTAKVHVVSPALNSPLRHLASDEDPARAAAQERLERSLRKLKEEGIEASGEVGDGDPLQALEDALRTFGADEIVISTHPEGRSNWLERGLVTQARERFAVPVDHVVVDLGDAS